MRQALQLYTFDTAVQFKIFDDEEMGDSEDGASVQEDTLWVDQRWDEVVVKDEDLVTQ